MQKLEVSLKRIQSDDFMAIKRRYSGALFSISFNNHTLCNMGIISLARLYENYQ